MRKPIHYRVTFSNKGFTLVEILIALLIFAWIGVASYQILDQIVRTQDANKTQSEVLSGNQRLVWQLGRDFRQMVDRSIVDEIGNNLDAIRTDLDEVVIEFTRAGWSNPLGWQRSELQRVAYRVGYHPESDDSSSEYYNDETQYLIRMYWQTIDRTDESRVREQAVMPNIVDMQVRFWDKQSQDWSDTPVSQSSQSNAPDLPTAVEVSLLTSEDELLSFIFKVL